MASSSGIVAVLMVAMVAAAAGVAEAQSDCISNLIPCADYLNSTSPSQTCCNGIRQVVTTQLPCLCRLYQNPAALGGINITQALMLPRYCNINADVSACNAPAPSSSNPPAVPGGNGNGNGGNGASRSISWMGMPVLILLSALTFFY